MLGYWDDADATAEVLRDGWLHTGDLGHRDADGYLYIDGRSVEMIKVGAFRVSPQEIEEVIAAMPGVEEVGVTAIADELLGQAIKAVVVRARGRRRSTNAPSRRIAASTWRPTRFPRSWSSRACCRAPLPARSSASNWLETVSNK